MNGTSNINWQQPLVTRTLRANQAGHRSAILWFTGLSGSGKSTLSHALELMLFNAGCRTFVLDGDNVRHGLTADLNFSVEDRHENIRRVGETARLFIEAGVIVLTAFISPFAIDRAKVRAMVPEGDFIEIYCRASLEICERRDVKGLYAKARAGQITEFTGISSPYEIPQHPELVIDTGQLALDVCVLQVVEYLQARNIININ